MKIISDCHIHIYPFYNIESQLLTLSKNLETHRPDRETIKVGFLAERFDCFFFNEIKEKKLTFNRINIENTAEAEAIIIHIENLSPLYLIAGKQTVTREKLEILALTLSEPVKDGLPSEEMIQNINNQNGIAVIPWGLGKWLFKRKKIIKNLLLKNNPKNFLLADSSLRPAFWPETLFSIAEKKGFSIIAGSDPLPFKGDEKETGNYGSVIEGNFLREKPVSSLRDILKNKTADIKYFGSRNSLFKNALRQLNHKISKH